MARRSARTVEPAPGRARHRAGPWPPSHPDHVEARGARRMNDLIAELERVRRAVGSETAGDGRAHVVELRRVYGAPIPDVWDVCTNPDRIARWFLPIGGDLRLGGRFQLEGNAGGE